MKKKLIQVLFMSIMVFLLAACEIMGLGGSTEDKDVTLLLDYIGEELAPIEALGELPEPKISNRLYYYDNAKVQGYFRGFHLGVELTETNQIQRIYLQPYGDHIISVYGFTLGDSVSTTEALFGEGKRTTSTTGGVNYEYITYQDQQYDIQCTLQSDTIVAVSISPLWVQMEQDEPKHIISAVWTNKEAIDNLGQPLELVTEEVDSDYAYRTLMAYDGIQYQYDHNRFPFNSVNVADEINITSPVYQLLGLDVQVGDSASDAFGLAESQFAYALDEEGAPIPYTFLYVEPGRSTPGGRTTWHLHFTLNKQVDIDSDTDLPEDLRILGIHLWTPGT